jgi:hypothetical protein
MTRTQTYLGLPGIAPVIVRPRAAMPSSGED